MRYSTKLGNQGIYMSLKHGHSLEGEMAGKGAVASHKVAPPGNNLSGHTLLKLLCTQDNVPGNSVHKRKCWQWWGSVKNGFHFEFSNSRSQWLIAWILDLDPGSQESLFFCVAVLPPSKWIEKPGSDQRLWGSFFSRTLLVTLAPSVLHQILLPLKGPFLKVSRYVWVSLHVPLIPCLPQMKY